jgi:hypothetical protein
MSAAMLLVRSPHGVGTSDQTSMTRAGLEPATYGLKERMLIVVLASLSIAKLYPGHCFTAKHRSVRFAQFLEESISYGFFRGSGKAD